MKKFAFVSLLIFVITGTANAAENLGIGYVNLRQVLIQSKIGKRNKAELDKLIKEKKDMITGEEAKLQAMQQAFQKEQMLMTDDQKQAKQKEFQGKVEAYQNMVADAKQAVDKKDSEFANKTLGEIKPVVAALAKELKLRIVFDATELSVLYAEEGMDLTQKVIEKYDAKAK